MLFILCVVTYGFQMEFTFELTAVKSSREARQYLWSEPDIVSFPRLCFSASPLLESHIETVPVLMFHGPPRVTDIHLNLTHAPINLPAIFSFHSAKLLSRSIIKVSTQSKQNSTSKLVICAHKNCLEYTSSLSFHSLWLLFFCCPFAHISDLICIVNILWHLSQTI